ncbi:MAG: cytochrome P450 [Anaerolineales bacterium]|nr:cytochrome P450 [Anaerolineales bacterium]
MQTNLVLENPAVGQKPSFSFIWNILRAPLHALTGLAQEQGDIAHIKLRKRDLFLFSHPEFIEEVLVKQQSNFIKGPSLQRARIILGEGLLTSEGDEHLAQRRTLQPAFHRHRMEEYLPVMNENTLTHISSWQNGARGYVRRYDAPDLEHCALVILRQCARRDCRTRERVDGDADETLSADSASPSRCDPHVIPQIQTGQHRPATGD